ncbi:MAG: phytoene synthase [Rhodospirillaceae bacterium]|nr:phytoene synthase [Rhodospirillaceae bacterium]
MNTPDSFLALAARARAADFDRYLCALFAPRRARAALFSLILFNAEIARVREAVSEPMLGQIRLQWWREAVDEIYRGQARHHEVVESLVEAVGRHCLSREYFDRLIDARERDLDETPFENLAALEAYAEESAAPLVALALEAAGAGASADLARHSGIAWALTGLMRAAPHLASQGRSVLPRELGAGASAVARVSVAARRHASDARRARRGMPSAAKRASLEGVLADAYLRRLASCGHDPSHARAALGPLRKQLLLGRAAFLGLA